MADKEELKMKFQLAEYNSLCKKVEKLLKETDDLAKYALLGTIAVWAWLSDEDNLKLADGHLWV